MLLRFYSLLSVTPELRFVHVSASDSNLKNAFWSGVLNGLYQLKLICLRALVISCLSSRSLLPLTPFSLSSLLRTPGILLHDISSLSPFPLSLKLLFSRSHTHCLSDTCLLTDSVLCELFTCALCMLQIFFFFPSCACGVINIGDPNTVIGCGPEREGWGAKEGQWRKMVVEGGGGGCSLPCSLNL